MDKRFMKWFVLLLVGILSVSVVTVGWAAEYTMKIAHSQPETSARNQSFLFFKDIVEKASNGRISVEVYSSGQLGTESEVMQSVQLGLIQATEGGKFEMASEKYLLYTLPFLFADPEEALYVMRSPIGDKINAEAEGNGYYVPACGIAGGFRQWTNNVRPIVTPDDIVGLKMRTPGIDSIIRTMTALGASPQSIPYVEVYMALKQGVADGEENPFSNIEQMKFYEVQKYVTVSNYQVHPNPFFISLSWYNSLPNELQKIVTEAAKLSMIYCDTVWLASEMDAFDVVKANCEVNFLTDDARAAFVAKVQPVWQYYVTNNVFSQSLLDEVLETIRNK